MTDNITPSAYLILQASADAARESAALIARAVNDSPNYTEEGRRDRYAKHTEEHRAHLAALTEQAERIITDSRGRVEQVKQSLLPTPGNDQAALAAEMQAQRILSRPGMDNDSHALNWIMDTPASPARTAVIEELQARGVLDADLVDAQLMGAHAEYRAAEQQALAAATAVNGIIKPKLNALAETLDNRHARSQDRLAGHVDVTAVPNLPDLDAGPIPAWTPTQAENAYRNDY